MGQTEFDVLSLSDSSYSQNYLLNVNYNYTHFAVKLKHTEM